MTLHRDGLLASLLVELPSVDASGAIATSALVRRWLQHGSSTPDDRRSLDALCRQIDVRKRVSQTYGMAFQRVDPELPAHPTVVGGLAAALLAHAAHFGGSPHDDGFPLKCINSALKSLEFHGVPHAPQLRGWALELLDAHTERSTR